VEGRHLFGDPTGRDRERDDPVVALGGDEVEHDEGGPMVIDRGPGLVHQRQPLPRGVEAHPEGRPGGADQLSQVTQRSAALVTALGRVGVVEPVVDGQDVDGQPAEQCREDQSRRAPAGVDDDLETSLREAA